MRLPTTERLLLLAFLLPLAGCLSTHPRVEAEPTPVFLPEQVFAGETEGLGTLVIRGRSAQLVRVQSTGAMREDGTFALQQTIRIGDEPPRERTWTLRRTPDGYVSSLTEADGPVRVEARGTELRVRYGMSGPLVMDQRLYLQPDGETVLNLSTVRFWGLPVARLTEHIRRAGAE